MIFKSTSRREPGFYKSENDLRTCFAKAFPAQWQTRVTASEKPIRYKGINTPKKMLLHICHKLCQFRYLTYTNNALIIGAHFEASFRTPKRIRREKAVNISTKLTWRARRRVLRTLTITGQSSSPIVSQIGSLKDVSGRTTISPSRSHLMQNTETQLRR